MNVCDGRGGGNVNVDVCSVSGSDGWRVRWIRLAESETDSLGDFGGRREVRAVVGIEGMVLV